MRCASLDFTKRALEDFDLIRKHKISYSWLGESPESFHYDQMPNLRDWDKLMA
jgi:hypothetical protein